MKISNNPLLKKKFYKISHKLHGDKLSHFLSGRDDFVKLNDEEKLIEIKKLTNSYITIKDAYTNNSVTEVEMERVIETLDSDIGVVTLSKKISELLNNKDNGTQDEGKNRYKNKTPAYVHNLNPDNIKNFNELSLRLVNVLKDFQKMYPSYSKIDDINYCIDKLRSVVNNSFVSPDSLDFLNTKISNVLKNYAEFKSDILGVENIKDVRAYIARLTTKIYVIIFIGLNISDINYIDSSKEMISYSKNFEKNLKMYKEKYTPIFSKADLDYIQKVFGKN